MVVCLGRTLYVRVDSRTGPDGSVRQRLIYLATAAMPCRATRCGAVRCGSEGATQRQCQRYRLRARSAVAAGRSSTAPIWANPALPTVYACVQLRQQILSRCPPAAALAPTAYAMLCCAVREQPLGAFSSTPVAVFSSAGRAMYVRTQARHSNTSPRALRHTVVEQCNPYRPKEPARHNLAVLGARTLLARMACNIQRE
jgi:hypothetical protein